MEKQENTIAALKKELESQSENFIYELHEAFAFAVQKAGLENLTSLGEILGGRIMLILLSLATSVKRKNDDLKKLDLTRIAANELALIYTDINTVIEINESLPFLLAFASEKLDNGNEFKKLLPIIDLMCINTRILSIYFNHHE